MSDSLGPDRTGTSDSVATDDGADIIIPAWVYDPRQKILGIVAAWLVGGILYFWRTILAVVLQAGDVLADVPAILGSSIGGAAGGVADAILALIVDVNGALIATASSAGALGWIVLGVGYALLLVGFVRGALFVLDLIDIPVIDLGTIVRGAFKPFTALWRVLR